MPVQCICVHFCAMLVHNAQLKALFVCMPLTGYQMQAVQCIDRGALIKVLLVRAEHCCCPIGMVNTSAPVVLLDWI